MIRFSLLEHLRTSLVAVGVALLALLSFGACTKDVVEPVEELPLVVAITDSGFFESVPKSHLLAKDFVAGDEIGVFLVRDGEIVEANIRLTYDGSAWNADKTVSVTGSELGFVYFPFCADASEYVDKSASNAADFFKELALRGVTYDQSTDNIARTKAFDLSVAKATVEKTDTELSVTAILEHLMSVAAWSLTDGTVYSTHSGFKYTTPSSCSNMKVSLGDKTITPGTIPFYYTFYYYPEEGKHLTVSYDEAGVSKSFDVQLGTESGKLTFLEEGSFKDGGARELSVGDLFYCDGSILPVETVREMSQAPSGVAGVVFQTDLSRISDKEKSVLAGAHALVLSARMPSYKGNTSMKWFDDYPEGKDDGNRNESVEDPDYPGMYLPFITDTKDYMHSYELNRADINGYWNNVVIRTRRAADMEKGWYPAFSAVVAFGDQVPAPSYSTGWYLPSAGQLMDAFANLGKVDFDDHIRDFNGNGDFLVDASYCADMIKFMDSYLEKIPSGERDLFSGATGALWSSSHSWTYFSTGDISYAARLVSFYNDFSVISYSTFGVSETRAVLAF